MSEKLIDFSIEWDGIGELLKNFDKLSDDVVKAIEKGVNEDAEDLLKVAQQLAPKLEGTLEGSGHLGKLEKKGKAIQQQVTFNTPYALRRHEEPYGKKEHMEYDPSGRPVGKVIEGRGPITRSKSSIDGMEPGRKYLERPLKRYYKKYQQHIADKVKEVLDK